MKQKHKRELAKVDSEYEAALESAQVQHLKNKEQWTNRLVALQDKTLKEKEKWQLKLEALNAELEKANDRVYTKKLADVPKSKFSWTKLLVSKWFFKITLRV